VVWPGDVNLYRVDFVVPPGTAAGAVEPVRIFSQALQQITNVGAVPGSLA
jgi:hypothetical protein